MRTRWAIAAGLLVAAWVGSAVAWPWLPERIPTHWNIHGDVDGWSPRPVGAFLLPGIMALLFFFFVILPWLSPKPFSVDGFRETSLTILILCELLLATIHGLALSAALSPGVPVGRGVSAALCVFFVAIGALMSSVRRNLYIGVRTPWTLADDRVWSDTHRLSAWTFGVMGGIGFLLSVVGGPLGLVVVALLVGALAPVVYSFIDYRRLERLGLLSSQKN